MKPAKIIDFLKRAKEERKAYGHMEIAKALDLPVYDVYRILKGLHAKDIVEVRTRSYEEGLETEDYELYTMLCEDYKEKLETLDLKELERYELDWAQKEDFARYLLQLRFKTPLSERRVIIGYSSDGTPQTHSFDIVSPDENIIGEVKALTDLTAGIEFCFAACYRLEKVKAKKKILVLTEKSFCNAFKRKSDGIVSKDIEIIPIFQVKSGDIVNK